MAVLPKGHPLAELDVVPIEELCREDFILVEKKSRSDAGELLKQHGLQPNIRFKTWDDKQHGLQPNVRFKTWDDNTVLAVVEAGYGVTILSDLILRRNPFDVEIRPLDVPAYRDIGIAMRDHETTSAAVRRFLGYLPLRFAGSSGTFLCGTTW